MIRKPGPENVCHSLWKVSSSFLLFPIAELPALIIGCCREGSTGRSAVVSWIAIAAVHARICSVRSVILSWWSGIMSVVTMPRGGRSATGAAVREI